MMSESEASELVAHLDDFETTSYVDEPVPPLEEEIILRILPASLADDDAYHSDHDHDKEEHWNGRLAKSFFTIISNKESTLQTCHLARKETSGREPSGTSLFKKIPCVKMVGKPRLVITEEEEKKRVFQVCAHRSFTDAMSIVMSIFIRIGVSC